MCDSMGTLPRSKPKMVVMDAEWFINKSLNEFIPQKEMDTIGKLIGGGDAEVLGLIASVRTDLPYYMASMHDTPLIKAWMSNNKIDTTKEWYELFPAIKNIRSPSRRASRQTGVVASDRGTLTIDAEVEETVYGTCSFWAKSRGDGQVTFLIDRNSSYNSDNLEDAISETIYTEANEYEYEDYDESSTEDREIYIPSATYIDSTGEHHDINESDCEDVIRACEGIEDDIDNAEEPVRAEEI